jgi:hypothetical protein
VAARSNALVCGRSPAEIVGSNPTVDMDVCLLWVLPGRGLCDELITRPEESYRLWCVVVCDLETSRMRPWPALGRSATAKKKYMTCLSIVIFFLHSLPFSVYITTGFPSQASVCYADAVCILWGWNWIPWISFLNVLLVNHILPCHFISSSPYFPPSPCKSSMRVFSSVWVTLYSLLPYCHRQYNPIVTAFRTWLSSS